MIVTYSNLTQRALVGRERGLGHVKRVVTILTRRLGGWTGLFFWSLLQVASRTNSTSSTSHSGPLFCPNNNRRWGCRRRCEVQSAGALTALVLAVFTARFGGAGFNKEMLGDNADERGEGHLVLLVLEEMVLPAPTVKTEGIVHDGIQDPMVQSLPPFLGVSLR